MLIKYLCNNPDCPNEILKNFKGGTSVPSFLDCGACGTGKLERQLGAPITKTTQFVDNGGMTKPVELSNEVLERQRDKDLQDEQEEEFNQ